MTMPWHGATLTFAGEKWMPSITVDEVGHVWWDGTDAYPAELLGWHTGTSVSAVELLGRWTGTTLADIEPYPVS